MNKKRLKSIVALLIAVAMLFTVSCGKKDKTETKGETAAVIDDGLPKVEGYYTEEDLPELEGGVSYMVLRPDGVLEVGGYEVMESIDSAVTGESTEEATGDIDAKAAEGEVTGEMPMPDMGMPNYTPPEMTINELKDGAWVKSDRTWLDNLKKKYEINRITAVRFRDNGNRVVLFAVNIIDENIKSDAEMMNMGFNDKPFVVEIDKSGELKEIAIDWHVVEYIEGGMSVVKADFESADNYGMSMSPGLGGGDAETEEEVEESESEESESEEASESGIYRGISRPYPSDLEVAKNGDILIKDQQCIFQYGLDGEYKKHYESAGTGIALMGDELFTSSYQMEAELFDITSTSNEASTSLKVSSAQSSFDSGINAISFDDIIYALTSEGIFEYKKGDSEFTQLTRNELLSFMMPNAYMDALAPDGSGGLYVFLNTWGGEENVPTITHVFHVNDAPIEITDELSVYSFYENFMLRASIAEFRKANPSVKVNYTVGYDYESTADMQDVIRTFNMELIAGKGADLIALENLPIDSFIEKGALEDINEFVEPKIASGDWVKPLAEAYKIDGKTYALSTSMSVPVIIGADDVIKNINTIDDLVEFAKSNKDKSLFSDMSRVYLMSNLFTMGKSEALDENGSINKAGMSKYLSGIKELMDLNPVESPMEKNYKKWGIQAEEPEGYFGGGQYIDILDYAFGNTALNIGALSGTNDFVMMEAGIKKGGGTYTYMPANGEKTFIPSGSFGINAASEKKELAYKLLDVILSGKSNHMFGGYGLPINKAGLEPEPLREGEEAFAITNAISRGSEDQMLEFGRYGEAESKKLIEFLSVVDTVNIMDVQLMNTMVIESKQFFAGAITADEAADKIIAASRIYMSE